MVLYSIDPNSGNTLIVPIICIVWFTRVSCHWHSREIKHWFSLLCDSLHCDSALLCCSISLSVCREQWIRAKYERKEFVLEATDDERPYTVGEALTAV